MTTQDKVAVLEHTVLRLSRCVAALAGALAGSNDPATAQVLERWETRLGEMDINLAVN